MYKEPYSGSKNVVDTEPTLKYDQVTSPTPQSSVYEELEEIFILAVFKTLSASLAPGTTPGAQDQHDPGNQEMPAHEAPLGPPAAPITGTNATKLPHLENGSTILGNHQCNQCGNTFGKLSTLKQHRASKHSHSKPYVCEICTKRFSKVSTLVKHKWMHEDKNNFRCRTSRAALKCSAWVKLILLL